MHHMHCCVLAQMSQICLELQCYSLCEVSRAIFLLLHSALFSLQSFNSLLHKLNKYVPRGSTVLICTPVLVLLGYRLLLQGNVGEINAP